MPSPVHDAVKASAGGLFALCALYLCCFFIEIIIVILLFISNGVNAPNAKAKMEEGEYVPGVLFYAWNSVVLPFLEEKHF